MGYPRTINKCEWSVHQLFRLCLNEKVSKRWCIKTMCWFINSQSLILTWLINKRIRIKLNLSSHREAWLCSKMEFLNQRKDMRLIGWQESNTFSWLLTNINTNTWIAPSDVLTNQKRSVLFQKHQKWKSSLTHKIHKGPQLALLTCNEDKQMIKSFDKHPKI